MNDLFDNQKVSLPKNVMEQIINKQAEDIEKLKNKIKLLEAKADKKYVFTQQTVDHMAKHVAKAEQEKFLAKSLLYEIYDSLSAEPSISIADILRYKKRIEEVFPEVRNKNII